MPDKPNDSGQPAAAPEGPANAEPNQDGASPAHPSEGEKVKINIGGKEFEVDPGLAESIDSSTSEREKEFARKLSERGDELGKLRKEKEAVVNLEQDTAELGELLFSEPEKFVAKVREQVQDAVKTASADIYSRITSATEAKGRKSQFWDRFYGKYPDLKKAKFIVEARLNQDMKELGELPVDTAIDELGKRIRKDLTSLGVTPKKDERKGNLDAEGESPVAFSAEGIKPPSGGKTLSDLIRGRRKTRKIS